MYGILHRPNIVLDKVLQSIEDEFSFSYVPYEPLKPLYSCSMVTELMVMSLYDIKYCKEKNRELWCGLVDGTLDYHLKSLKHDISVMKRHGLWSYDVENVIHEYHKKKELQEQLILSLSKHEQEQIRQARLEKAHREFNKLVSDFKM